MKIGIIDYGSGNFTSVYNAVNSIRNIIKIIHSPVDFSECSHIILPGVGAYTSAMEKLRKLNLIDVLNDEVITKKKPFLGICVGMQLLADCGFEFGKSVGLGWIPGEVVKFHFDKNTQLTLPHIGWNNVVEFENQRLFNNINKEEPSFYFVHSYHLISDTKKINYTYCNYGYKFIAAVEKENIFGVQFHPEKSQTNGLQVLNNFIKK